MMHYSTPNPTSNDQPQQRCSWMTEITDIDFAIIAGSEDGTFDAGGCSFQQASSAKLATIPTMGSADIFSSYASVWKFIVDGRDLVEAGCRKL
ncbi:hypothetical protein PM082_013625 [Marasmius tenuissimus]|nr:hypothetical protein PM082_013625 [Marasmius tenuissimus]